MRKTYFQILIVVMAAASFASVAAAQDFDWGFGPVVVFSERDGRGTASSFNVGEFRNDRGEFGTLRNDSASSVSVPAGYRVKFCENEGRNGRGDGRCEEFTAGNNNLRYANSASYIRVLGPRGSGNSGGWNGGGARGVTVYEDRDRRGRSQSFGLGRYLNAGGGLGNLRNDKASSVVVERGFRVRLCESEGNGAGEGRCETYNEGTFNLQNDNEVSYVEVQRARGWGNGGGWNNNGGNWGGGWNNNNNNWSGLMGSNAPVKVFADRNQSGNYQGYGIGLYRNNLSQFGSLRNDEASSVWVANGFRVRLCESEGGGNGSGRCEEFGPGSYNLRYNDKASWIRVWQN